MSGTDRTRSLRIAYLADPTSIHTARWVREFKDRGHECKVFTTRMPGEPLIEWVELLGREGFPGRLDLTVVRSLRCHLRLFQPHILHVHYALDYGAWAAASLFRPYVVTCWGSDIYVAPSLSRLERQKVVWGLHHASLVTADSLDLCRAAAKLGARRVQQIVIGVETSRFRPVTERPVNDVPVILSTRRLEPDYRVAVLVEAAAALKSYGMAFRLLIASFGSQLERLRRQVNDLGLSDRVELLGKVTDDEMLCLYQMSDVYVSVPVSDGTSVSLLEAMSCGLPVVASDIPANREGLGAGSPLLVPCANPHALADALASLLESPSTRRLLGMANRNRVVRDGNWSASMDRTESLYASLAFATDPEAQGGRI